MKYLFLWGISNDFFFNLKNIIELIYLVLLFVIKGFDSFIYVSKLCLLRFAAKSVGSHLCALPGTSGGLHPVFGQDL